MRLSITKAIKDILRERFESMLMAGAFPEVHFSKSNPTSDGVRFHSYHMIEYATTWSRFVKTVDEWMKCNHLDEELGVFTRKRSKKFLEDVRSIAWEISEQEVYKTFERFATMFD